MPREPPDRELDSRYRKYEPVGYVESTHLRSSDPTPESFYFLIVPTIFLWSCNRACLGSWTRRQVRAVLVFRVASKNCKNLRIVRDASLTQRSWRTLRQWRLTELRVRPTIPSTRVQMPPMCTLAVPRMWVVRTLTRTTICLVSS